MKVYDTANRLASEIKDSQEYKLYKQAKEKIDQNPDLKGKIEEFEKVRYDAQVLSIKAGESDKEKITKAYLLAEKMHECQFRKNNDPYIIHPVEVSKILLSLNADSDTICA